ncbi:transcription antitermination factor NusB [Mogibacterium neglectum]|uniref:transcription antitermination factor NusB n=1 Tax=Mogibacterium neglectum TaxID=114528 RepID=UPI002729CEAD|nr:transcription antitermination factor NusB [Mogibacterium neglectum]WLD75516.1 transcription antitermination factor NusB [Mogibacterium neglectum]
MDRRTIRENIMQFVYQMDLTDNFDYEQLTCVEEAEKALKQKQALETLSSIRDHIGEIDKLISKNIDNWDINRLPKADLAILRTALAEILYVDSIPANVSINEAVELGKTYGDERSYAFINSVLGKINRELNEQ